MEFINDWKRQFPKLWSVRLSLLAAVASGVEVSMQLYVSGSAPLLVVGAGMVSIGSAIARIVAQPKLTKGKKK